MNVGSLFSGIGGLDHGLARAGFRHAFLCEGGGDPNGTREERQQWATGKWRRSVLAARFPGVPIYEDVRDVGVAGAETGRRTEPGDAAGEGVRAGGEGRPLGWPGHVDLLCGGFPCQDLSVAGQRRGIAGDRSGLFFEFARVTGSLRPRWLLVENVPGLLSSQGGRDFGVVLGTLADLGYGLAWRVLDSRFFGVPQRRRRVFIVGAFADGDPRAAAERAGAVLAVGSRCGRHLEASREAGPGVAGALGGVPPGGGWRFGADEAAVNQLVAAPLSHGSNPNSNMAGRRREDDENLVAYGASLGTAGETQHGLTREASPPMTTRHGDPGYVMRGASVRRLTPTECERLQALPYGWTDPHGDAPDSRRYAGLGDAVTASVAEWIGRRIMEAAA